MRNPYLVRYEIPPMRAILEREVLANSKENAEKVFKSQIHDKVKIHSIVEK